MSSSEEPLDRVPIRGEIEAVLITGVFGSGKTSVTEELADVLGERGVAYAALDLDWLAWFDTGSEDEVL
ncbi:MAG: hypothetical protein ACRDTR_00680 [Rubrobacter sp.]